MSRADQSPEPIVYENIRYEVSDHIATISLDRSGKLNAYTPEMGEELVAAFERARGDERVRVVILTGEGRAFCSGVDLEYLEAHMSGTSMGSGPRLGEEAFVRTWPLELVEYPKPVIAAINGVAYGVGVTMTLGCDVRVAANGAKLGLNFAGLGVLPGLGSTHLLPQLIGMAKSLELVLSAATISAEEALRIGLVQRVVAPEVLLAEARELAGAMAKCRPDVLTAAKAALRRGASAGMEEAMKTERALSADLGVKRDQDEDTKKNPKEKS
jgi:2-(1,2-epoxy-1,2-dihydrophenyl)acetyl-CoA isomerase